MPIVPDQQVNGKPHRARADGPPVVPAGNLKDGWMDAKPFCPICNKSGWCRTTLDGRIVLCRRREEGCYSERGDINGTPYYLHSRDAEPGMGGMAPHGQRGKAARRARANDLDAVYALLLELLELTTGHRENLRQRGLSNKEIERRGYRSLAREGRKSLADRVVKGLVRKAGAQDHGSCTKALLMVPGFILKGEEDSKYLTLAGPAGLLVPVRDDCGRIAALKVRADNPGDGGKYVYSSSTKHDGPGPGCPIHFPIGWGEGGFCPETVRLTEGELKADIATALWGTFTVGLPGATIWRPALALLQLYGPRSVRLAFDADARTNAIVAKAQLECARCVVQSGLALELEVWDPADGKGIDDLLAAGKEPLLLAGEEAMAEAERIAAEAGCKETGRSAAEEGGKGRGREKRSQATRLVDYARGALDLFHSPEGQAFAATRDQPRQTFALRSRPARQFLSRLFYMREETAPGSEATLTAVNTLEGIAVHDGPEHPVFVRLAERDGRIFLDLGDSGWRAVAIGPDGWEVIEDCPVHFQRSRGTLALPVPARGGSVDELRPIVNVTTDDDWRLLIGWLLGALRPGRPCTVLFLGGEQGSGKSMKSRLLRGLADPNSAALRSEPRDARDLIIAANNSWVVCLDNLSHLQPWLSDALCRLATGGGFSTRELYTDSDEILFDAMRPVILNGIEDLATRGDLLDRSIVVTLPAIREEDRRTEEEVWAEYERCRPRVLGALLDAVATGLKNLPTVEVGKLPRMADFARWVTACEPALSWEPRSFLNSYHGNVRDSNELALADSPLVAPLRRFFEESVCKEWSGTASELLEKLNKLVDDKMSASKDWPKRPNALSGRLRRLAPNLRKIGLSVEFGHRHGGWKHIVLSAVKVGKRPFPSSPSLPEPENNGESGTDGEEEDRYPANDHLDASLPPNPRKTRENTGSSHRGNDGNDQTHTFTGARQPRNAREKRKRQLARARELADRNGKELE